MNLSDLANLSQIIAAVGVVISIVYLAVQFAATPRSLVRKRITIFPNSLCASRFFAPSTQIGLPSLRVEWN